MRLTPYAARLMDTVMETKRVCIMNLDTDEREIYHIDPHGAIRERKIPPHYNPWAHEDGDE